MANLFAFILLRKLKVQARFLEVQRLIHLVQII